MFLWEQIHWFIWENMIWNGRLEWERVGWDGDVVVEGREGKKFKELTLLVWNNKIIPLSSLEVFTSRIPLKAILKSFFWSLIRTLWKVCLKREELNESPITIWPLESDRITILIYRKYFLHMHLLWWV